MLREILKSNGVFDKLEILIDYPLNDGILIRTKLMDNNNCLCYTGYAHDSHKDSKEEACRQYVKENGFKLEWLKSYIEKIYDIEIHKKEKYYRFYNLRDNEWMYYGDEKSWTVLIGHTNDKLLCWLYANDVKIIER